MELVWINHAAYGKNMFGVTSKTIAKHFLLEITNIFYSKEICSLPITCDEYKDTILIYTFFIMKRIQIKY